MDAKTIQYYQGLAREPSLASQLPYTFDNGCVWTMDDLRARCQHCQAIFPDSLFTGRFTPHGRRQLMMDALGFCPTCQKVTPCHYRLFDDRQVEGQNAQGLWVRSYVRTSFRQRCQLWWATWRSHMLKSGTSSR